MPGSQPNVLLEQLQEREQLLKQRATERQAHSWRGGDRQQADFRASLSPLSLPHGLI